EQLKKPVNVAAGQQRKIAGGRALLELNSLRKTLRTWFTFYNGYDPMFTWWAAADYGKTDAALQAYGAFLREKVLNLKPASGAATPGNAAKALVTAQPGDTSDIVGQPV